MTLSCKWPIKCSDIMSEYIAILVGHLQNFDRTSDSNFQHWYSGHDFINNGVLSLVTIKVASSFSYLKNSNLTVVVDPKWNKKSRQVKN